MMGIMFHGTTSGAATAISRTMLQRPARVSRRANQMPSGIWMPRTSAENSRLRRKLAWNRSDVMISSYQMVPTQKIFSRVNMSKNEKFSTVTSGTMATKDMIARAGSSRNQAVLLCRFIDCVLTPDQPCAAVLWLQVRTVSPFFG